MASSIESETSLTDANQISTNEEYTNIIDLPTTNEDTNSNESLLTSTSRTTGQTPIGAKLIKKLEILAANAKENKQLNDQSSCNNGNATNESDIHRNINKVANNLIDADPQKQLLTLATTLAELQEQNRSIQLKTNDIEKRATVVARERDQILHENSRASVAKSKLEGLCRELHRHNQQIRDESAQLKQEDETKRQELSKKFQTTIDEIQSQLSNYSTQSASLGERNVQLSEQLASVVKEYDAREKEFEEALNKKATELHSAEVNLEKNHLLLSERAELIKQERQVSEDERLTLHKRCEELVASELSLRSQVTAYAERYQEFQNAIEQSSQMVTSCQAEIEKMREKIKNLEKERNEFRHHWNIAEQNQRKLNEDMKLMEKEKRQLDIKVDKLDRLCRSLQQERSNLQVTVKNLSKSSTPRPKVATMENGELCPVTVSSTCEIDKISTLDIPTPNNS